MAIRSTPILILDEPTTGLDKESEKAVIEALQRLAREPTTFIITHDLDLASQAEWIFDLEAGQIQEQGTHEQLLRINGRYAQLDQIQSSKSDRQISEIISV